MTSPIARITETTDIQRLLESLAHAKTLATVRRHESALRKLLSDGSPILRGRTAHFFFDAHLEAPIHVVGDWNNWQPTDRLTRVHPQSSLLHLRKEFPVDARFAYRVLVDGRDSLLDPLNPLAEQEVFGTNSVVRMPAFVPERLAGEPDASVPRGRLREFAAPGKKGPSKRDYSRTVHVYLPHDLRKPSQAPVLYVHDGTETIAVGKMVNILDNLFYEEPHLPRAVVVFVPPKERDREYMLHPGYAEWLAHTLVPSVESRFRLSPTSDRRGTLGASLGGLLSAQLGFLYPKVFGAIAVQSPAFWVQHEKIVQMYAGVRRLPLRWYAMTGVINDAEEGARSMLRVLMEKGYPVRYRETNQSHNWANWQGTYAEIVRWFVRNE